MEKGGVLDMFLRFFAAPVFLGYGKAASLVTISAIGGSKGA